MEQLKKMAYDTIPGGGGISTSAAWAGGLQRLQGRGPGGLQPATGVAWGRCHTAGHARQAG